MQKKSKKKKYILFKDSKLSSFMGLLFKIHPWGYIPMNYPDNACSEFFASPNYILIKELRSCSRPKLI